MTEHISANFFETLKQSKGVKLVDVWAPWCGPCKILSPILDEISKEEASVEIYKINADEQPEAAAKLKVRALPTMIIFKDGIAVETLVGAQSKQKILETLRKYY